LDPGTSAAVDCREDEQPGHAGHADPAEHHNAAEIGEGD
jgi:hypothetical protein